MQMMVGGVGHPGWPHCTERFVALCLMDGADRPPWDDAAGWAALALAVGVVVDDGVVSVQYERMIGLSALGFALTYLGIRAVVMPQMSPNDIIRHHPWALCAAIGRSLLVSLGLMPVLWCLVPSSWLLCSSGRWWSRPTTRPSTNSRWSAPVPTRWWRCRMPCFCCGPTA